MVQRNHRLDTIGYQFVYQIVVIPYSVFVDIVREPRWQNARPRYGKAVEIHSELFEQSNIFLVLVVGIAGDSGVASVHYKVWVLFDVSFPYVFTLA